jgi:hypothetical protein
MLTIISCDAFQFVNFDFECTDYAERVGAKTQSTRRRQKILVTYRIHRRELEERVQGKLSNMHVPKNQFMIDKIT